EIAAWEKLSHGIKQSKKEIKPLDAPEI
ncbi:TPA: 30S ribosomal protein S6, partial [Campylobacter jejuni]|nr:30S ribosomal protein S6 [Campylobacter jejuni]